MHCSRSNGPGVVRFVPTQGLGVQSLGIQSLCGFALLLISVNPGPLPADAAKVRFDTPAAVACVEVGEELGGSESAPTRLVEATLTVSAWTAVNAGSEGLRYEYQFVAPSGAIEVVDYTPRTVQTSSVAGNVAMEETVESNKAVNASVSGMFPPFGQGEGQAEMGKKSLSHARYELKPRQETALVAGTLQRGTGVYFRLLPTADQMWEGAQEFKLVLRVPRSWRADLVFVRCAAYGPAGDRSTQLGSARFVVGLRMSGDEEANAALDTLQRTEVELRHMATARQRDIQRRATPTVVHKLGELLDVAGPRIPEGWVDRLVYGPASLESHPFVKHLPDDLRQLAGRYLERKRQVNRLSSSASEGQLAATPRRVR